MSFARNCNTMTKSYVVSVRMDDAELEILDRIANGIGKSRSETIRLCLLFVDIYFTRGLTLADIIKPLPEVMEYLERRLKEERL